jgi:hypothetical protein
MFIEFHVEEPSAEDFLKAIVPRILTDPSLGGRIRRYPGKPNMLKKLPQRLAASKLRMRYDPHLIVVLIDEDRQDCLSLKLTFP